MAFNFSANSFSAPSSGGFSFGAPSTPSNALTTTTFGATNNNSAPSFSFGLGNTASPSTTGGFGGFGGSSTSSFGATAFGSNTAPTGGGFGAGTTFGNTNPSTSTFGSNPVTSFGSPSASTFGSNFSATTNTFGSNTGSFGGGGGSYKPTDVREQTGQPMTTYLHICAMDSFKTLTADMVRWQDYKKGPAPTAPTPFGAPTTSAFGQTNPTATPSAFSFNSTTPTAFGAPSSTSTPNAFSFGGAKPTTGTPSAFSFGQTSTPTPSAFGNNSTGTTTFGSFGAPSTGFGTPNSSAPSTFSSFGAPSASPSQFSFANTTNAAPANNSSFSFGNTSNNTNTAAPSSFTFGNTATPAPSTTTSGFGSFGTQAPTTSPSSFSFGNKPAAFGQQQTNSFSFTSPTANNSAPQTNFFTGGFSGQGTANSVNQQPKVELPMTQDPYGKLPDVSMPAARTRPLPAPVVKPATPSSASHSYKLTPKTMKKLLIMESPSSPAHIDNEQRVLNELLSPHTHVKKLVITEADQQNLSLYESNRKLQKSVLKDLSNQQKEQSSFSPPDTPYQVPKKHISHVSLRDRSGEKPDERQIDAMDQNLRQSTKDSLSLSFKPTPVRVQPSGQYFHRPGIEGLADSSSMTKSRDYNSYTEAVVDNRPDIEVDKSVPVPKCTRSGVQTVPSMEFLLKMTKDELMNVNNFTISKEDVGKVTFPGLTDVRGLDLDRIVSFKDREITLYPNDSDKPASGEGLNKPADITLFRCFPTDKKTNRPTEDPAEIDAFVKKLKKRCRRWNCRFKSYDHGNWTFTIDNFAD